MERLGEAGDDEGEAEKRLAEKMITLIFSAITSPQQWDTVKPASEQFTKVVSDTPQTTVKVVLAICFVLVIWLARSIRKRT